MKVALNCGRPISRRMRKMVARGNSRHDVGNDRGQVMVLVQPPKRTMQKEAMNEVVEESTDAKSDDEQRSSPGRVGSGGSRPGYSDREIRKLTNVRKGRGQRQLNRRIPDARCADRDNHRGVRAYHAALPRLASLAPVLVEVEGDECGLHVDEQPNEGSGV
jgi:hypothetical protein